MVRTPHPSPFEVVETAVDVVDLAWTALERRRQRETARERLARLAGELSQERTENQRLRRALEESHKAVDKMQTLQSQSEGDVSAALLGNKDADCPSDLYQRLKEKVDSPGFLVKLEELQQADHGENKDLASINHGEDIMVNANPEDPSWWLWVADDLFIGEPIEEVDHLDNDSYILVSEDDVLEGVAMFVARCIYSNPHAKNLQPEELQEAILKSLTKLESKGKIRKVWGIAKFLYIGASWSAAAIGLYKNPFILRVILRAISASSRLVIKVFS